MDRVEGPETGHWWYLEAGGDAGPKAEVQGEQNNCV